MGTVMKHVQLVHRPVHVLVLRDAAIVDGQNTTWPEHPGHLLERSLDVRKWCGALRLRTRSKAESGKGRAITSARHRSRLLDAISVLVRSAASVEHFWREIDADHPANERGESQRRIAGPGGNIQNDGVRIRIGHVDHSRRTSWSACSGLARYHFAFLPKTALGSSTIQHRIPGRIIIKTVPSCPLFRNNEIGLVGIRTMPVGHLMCLHRWVKSVEGFNTLMDRA